MLQITIPSIERYDPVENLFLTSKEQKLTLEHSLVSLSKWEAKWCKPFLSRDDKTTEESVDYIRCMTLTQNVDPDVYLNLTPSILSEVNEYIAKPMTATTFSDKGQRPNREVITAEIIYYWMISLGVPFECQKWHLNRLLALIRVCDIKNSPKKKMSKNAIMSRNTSLNAARRAAMNSRG